MLDQIARHGLVDLFIEAQGDLHIDAHHTVEDIGITLGQAFARAVGDKRGIRRYGHAYVPLDEALSRVVIDLSGRPGLIWQVDFRRCGATTRIISAKRFSRPLRARFEWQSSPIRGSRGGFPPPRKHSE